MNYELAKKLKDAGFPQKRPITYRENQEWYEGGDDWEKSFTPDGRKEDRKKLGLSEYAIHVFDEEEKERLGVYRPPLSELIEACGENFFELQRLLNGEFVALHNPSAKGFDGKTPEESVAKLWLALYQITIFHAKS